MKKFLFLVAFIATTLGISAQTGDLSLMGQLGYQTNYERSGIGLQGRYNIANNWRIAPDVTFFFPKDKVTGLDVNVNLHYVFRFTGERFTVYPLAGFGMQNNFFGGESKSNPNNDGDSTTRTKLAFNLGGGITYNVGTRSYINAEAKFMFADDDSAVIMVGYGMRF